MKEPDHLSFLSTLLAVLGIILFFYSPILGIILIVAALVCVGFRSINQRLDKLEQKIEMINSHCIKNDERLYKIEQDIKKSETNETS